MSSNATNMVLPPYLDLPPHLSAHKYFFVCTLTVMAWETLVLCPRTYRLYRMPKEWPILKIAFFFLRIMMPIEFIVMGKHPCSNGHSIVVLMAASCGILRHTLDDIHV